jgi:hypothetical protein
MQRPIHTFRLDEPYGYPDEDEGSDGPGTIGSGCENADLHPAERARDGAPQPPPRSMQTTDWIVAIAMSVLAAAVAYYAVTSNRNSRWQYQLLASPSHAAAAAGLDETRAERQAWVGLPLPTAAPLSREGGSFAIKLRNFGKTPALKVVITDYVVIEDLDHLDGMQDMVSSSPMSAGTLMPDSEFDTDIGFRTSPEGVTSLVQGKVRAVNYALITYEDIYHRKHTTQSCFYWHGGLRAPLPCEQFNTVE